MHGTDPIHPTVLSQILHGAKPLRTVCGFAVAGGVMTLLVLLLRRNRPGARAVAH
jgi:hypothetical protein